MRVQQELKKSTAVWLVNNEDAGASGMFQNFASQLGFVGKMTPWSALLVTQQTSGLAADSSTSTFVYGSTRA